MQDQDDLAVDLKAQAEEARRERLRRQREALVAQRRKELGESSVPNAEESGDRSLLGMAGAVAGDIAGGVVEAPGAAMSGVIDAINSTLSFADEAGDSIGRALNFNPTIMYRDLETGELTAPRITFSQEQRDLAKQKLAELGYKSAGEFAKVPDIAPEQNTNTGKAVESIAQFVTGFLGAGKLKAGGQITTAALKGSVADFLVFDGHEERLSNLIQDVPALQNPVSQFLAADEEDNEIVGRLKNTIEGAGLGVATDSFVAGLRAIKKSRAVRPGIEAIEEADEVLRAKIEADAKAANDEIQRILSGTDDTAGNGARAAPDEAGDPEQFLQNLVAKFDTADGVRSSIESLARKDIPGIDAARRGRRSWQKTKAAAENVDAFKTLSERRTGEALNAEQLDAAYDLYLASTRRVMRAANAYQRGGRTDAGAYAMSQVIEQHRMIQREVIGARAEAGRALNIIRKKTADGQDFMLELDGALTEAGGRDTIDAIAARIGNIGPGQTKILDEFLEKSAQASTADMVAEVWRGALLSSPKTHIVNALSNTAVMAYDIVERYAAGQLGRLVGDPEAASMVAEAGQRAVAMRQAVAGQFKHLAETRSFDNMGVDTLKVDADNPGAITAKNLGLGEGSPVAASADAIGAVVRAPQNALGFADDFFKGVNYMTELHGEAFQRARAEVAAGRLAKEDMSKRIAELVDDPSEAMREIARTAAQERTFTKPAPRGSIVDGIGNIRRRMNVMGIPFGHIVLPFINTPANILKYTFSRSPSGLLMRDVQDKLARGGKDAMLARAQIGLGTSAVFLGTDYAMNGQMSGVGPSDYSERQALERQGWRPNSVKIGNTWIDHGRFDPFSAWFGMGSSFAEIHANMQEGDLDGDVFGIGAQAAGAMGNAMLSKTYLTGLSDLVTYINDPERYGDNYIERITSAFVPAGVADIRRMVDPQMRDAQSVIDAAKNRIPTLSDELPQSYDLWGRPRSYQSHFGQVYDGLIPFIARKADAEPIDEELSRLRYFPDMPERTLTVPMMDRSVSVSLRRRPDIYQRYVELAGNGADVRRLKLFPGGMGAKDFLNKMIASPQYDRLDDGPEAVPGSKAYEIRRVVSLSRRAAREQVLREYRQDLQGLARQEQQRLEQKRADQEAAEQAAAMELLLEQQ